MPKHIHAELIKAWADGAEIECLQEPAEDGVWEVILSPSWHPNAKYRIKPTPKPNIVMYGIAKLNSIDRFATVINLGPLNFCLSNNIKLTFSGKTGELTAVELIKGDSSCIK